MFGFANPFSDLQKEDVIIKALYSAGKYRLYDGKCLTGVVMLIHDVYSARDLITFRHLGQKTQHRISLDAWAKMRPEKI